MITIDIETTGLNPQTDDIRCLGYYSKDSSGVLTELSEIKEFLLTHKNSKFILHNGKFDKHFLLVKTGIKIDIWFDTMLAGYLLPDNFRKLSLAQLHYKYLGKKLV